jgi:hypothetical protein
MKVNVSLEQNYTEFDRLDFILPNSISIDGDKIIITDSGNNRVCVIDEADEHAIGGEFGIGKYKFKEPVYSTSSENFVFVCDWHNHRIVIYKDKKFVRQIGLFGILNQSKFINFLKLLRNFKSNGSFSHSHFNGESEKCAEIPVVTSLKNTVKSVAFYLFNPNILINNIFNAIYISKPNGCVLIKDVLYFTQKNNLCITAYNINSNKVVMQIDNYHEKINFGRLGQITEFNGKLYVCDETNNKVWIFTLNLEFLEFISITNYNIFSISINDNYIATCGVTSFSLFDHSYNKLFESSGNGEYHGVCIDNNSLYIANRLMHRIEKYKIKSKL